MSFMKHFGPISGRWASGRNGMGSVEWILSVDGDESAARSLGGGIWKGSFRCSRGV